MQGPNQLLKMHMCICLLLIMLKKDSHTQCECKEGFSFPLLSLTGLDEEELLGLCTHVIWCTAVIAPKVIFRLRGYLEDDKNSKYMKGTVPKQTDKCVCQTLRRWPLCLSIRVAYFYLLLWASLLLNYSLGFFPQWGLKKTLHKFMLMKSWWHKVCLCGKDFMCI